MIHIYPYRMASASATALRDGFRNQQKESLKISSEARFTWRNQLIINWGNSNIPHWYREENSHLLLNNTEAVARAANKMTTLVHLERQHIPIVPYFLDANHVMQLLEDGEMLFARTRLNAHSGGGIVVMRRPEDFIAAHLYTRYIKKRNEFRVHVFKNNVILTQEKRANRDFIRDEDGALIRSHQNGWVFCTENLPIDIDYNLLRQIAVDSIAALGLDFGAVDIIYNKHYDRFHVLEVNTAVGLEGRTLEAYTNAILGYEENRLRG